MHLHSRHQPHIQRNQPELLDRRAHRRPAHGLQPRQDRQGLENEANFRRASEPRVHLPAHNQSVSNKKLTERKSEKITELTRNPTLIHKNLYENFRVINQNKSELAQEFRKNECPFKPQIKKKKLNKYKYFVIQAIRSISASKTTRKKRRITYLDCRRRA